MALSECFGSRRLFMQGDLRGPRTAPLPCHHEEMIDLVSPERGDRRSELCFCLFGAADPAEAAPAVDDEGHWHHAEPEAGRDRALSVDDDREREAVAFDLCLGVDGPLILGDTDKHDVAGALAMEVLEGREGALARVAPLGEELDHEQPSAQASGVEVVAGEGQA